MELLYLYQKLKKFLFFCNVVKFWILNNVNSDFTLKLIFD